MNRDRKIDILILRKKALSGTGIVVSVPSANFRLKLVILHSHKKKSIIYLCWNRKYIGKYIQQVTRIQVFSIMNYSICIHIQCFALCAFLIKFFSWTCIIFLNHCTNFLYLLFFLFFFCYISLFSLSLILPEIALPRSSSFVYTFLLYFQGST